MDYIHEMAVSCAFESALIDISMMPDAMESNDASSKKSIIKKIIDGIMKIIRGIIEKVSRAIYRLKRAANINGTRDAANTGDEILSKVNRCITELNGTVKSIELDIDKMARFYSSKTNFGKAFFEEDDKINEHIEDVNAIIDKLDSIYSTIENEKVIIDYRSKNTLSSVVLYMQVFNSLCEEVLSKYNLFNDVVKNTSDVDPEIVRRINMHGKYVSRVAYAANKCNMIMGKIQGL